MPSYVKLPQFEEGAVIIDPNSPPMSKLRPRELRSRSF